MVNSPFGDCAKVSFRIFILGYQQHVSAQYVRNPELQRHIRVQPGEVDDDMRCAADFVPYRAQDVGREHAIAADVFGLAPTGIVNPLHRGGRPCRAESGNVKTAAMLGVRITAWPRRRYQLRRVGSQESKRGLNQEFRSDGIGARFIVERGNRSTNVEVRMTSEVLAQKIDRCSDRGPAGSSLQTVEGTIERRGKSLIIIAAVPTYRFDIQIERQILLVAGDDDRRSSERQRDAKLVRYRSDGTGRGNIGRSSIRREIENADCGCSQLLPAERAWLLM